MTAPARPAAALVAAFLTTGVLGAAAWAADPPAPQPPSPSVSTQAPAKPGPARVAQASRVESRPTWNELTPPQQQALAPLTGSWSRLSEAHKRKWLAVSANYPTMPPGEQARLHTRMAEWTALSPQQRTQARLNFAETQQVVAPDDKKAKWDAYQALSPEEKKKLAAGAAADKPVAPPTAAAVQPVPQQKLTRMPSRAKQADTRVPSIAGAPAQVDQNTLLPQPGALPVQP